MSDKRKITLLVELEYDNATHGHDAESMEWFRSDILGADPESDSALILHSNEIGCEVGAIRVLEVLTELGRGGNDPMLRLTDLNKER